MVQRKIFYLLCLISILTGTYTTDIYAQCSGGTPSYVVDLSANPDASWSTPTLIKRGGSCCSDNNCVEFIVTLHPDAERIKLSITDGAVPSGSLFWQSGCSGSNSVNTEVCISGVGPHRITFCKPGANKNEYTITSYKAPSAGPTTYASDGCTGTLTATGYEQSTIQWKTVFPGADGDYNSYLSCLSACSTSTVTAQLSNPAYIDVEVSGVPVGGCSSFRFKDTVRVNFISDKAVVINPPQPTVCFGGNTTSITANPVGGAPPYVYLWNTGETTQSIPVGPGTYWVKVSDQTDCPPVYDTITVTAYLSPITSNAGPDVVTCKNNANATLTGTVEQATGGIWSGGAGSYSPSNTSLTATYIPTPGEIAAGTPIKHILTTTGNGSCPPVTDTTVQTFLNAPTVEAGPNQTVCANSSTVSLAGSVTIATGGRWSGGTGIFFPNDSTLNANYTPSLAERTAGTVKLYLTTIGNGSCNSVIDSMFITINPAPTSNAGINQTVCANNNVVSLTGAETNASGRTWTTSGTGAFGNANALNTTYTPSAADITAGTVRLYLTTTNAPLCSPVTDTMVVTITAAPVVGAGVDRTVCGNNASVVLTGSVTAPATGGIWTSTGSGSFSANNTALNATYLPSSADTAAGSVTLRLTSTGNGICNAVYDEMTITYTDAPIANAGPNQTVCGNKATVTLSGAVTVATGAQWSTSGSGVFGSTTSLNTNYTPSSADTAAGTVRLILTTTGNASCNAVKDTMVITINDAPTVTAGADRSVCANNVEVALAGIVTVAGGGTWTGGAGTFSPNANTLNATYTPTATEITNGTVNLRLTTTGNGLCNSVFDDMVITITPRPVVNAGTNQSICNNKTTVNLAGTVTVATGGNWTSSGSGSFANANALTTTYTPSPADTAAGSITLTLTSTGNGTCLATADNLTVTFTPSPTITAGIDRTVCANNATVNLAGSTTVATAAQWSGGLGTFTPNATTLNASYVPHATEISNKSVTLTLTTTAQGNCNPVSDQMTISITDAPTVNAGADNSVCANNNSISLGGSVTVATGGTWTGGTGTFNPNATTLNATYTPSATEINNGGVTLRLTTTGNGLCTAVFDEVIYSITPAPTVNAGTDKTVCGNNAVTNLTGTVTVATGGTWTSSGTGTFSNATVLNPTYTPSAADTAAGSVTLTLTTTGNGKCIAVNDALILTITDAPTVNAGTDRTVCANNANVSLSGSLKVATAAIWTSTGTGTFAPDAANLNAIYIPSSADTSAGNVTLTLTSTAHGSCAPVSDNMLVTITDATRAIAGPDQTVCANNANVTLAGSVVVATGGTWTGGNGTFSPNANTLNATYTPTITEATNGTVRLVLTTTGNGACIATKDTMVITITPTPTVNAGPDQTVCANNDLVNLSGAVTIASGAVWSNGAGTFNPGNNSLNATYNPTDAESLAGTVNLVLTTTGNGNCLAVTDTVSITITPAPTANAGPDQFVCSNNPTVNITAAAVTVASGGQWSSAFGGTSFAPNSATVNNLTYTPSAAEISIGITTLILTTTGNGNCLAAVDTMRIFISAAPTVNAGADQNVCKNNINVNLTGTYFGSATSLFWTNGGGTYAPTNATQNTAYTPTAAEITQGFVNLVFNASRAGCNTVSDTMRVNFTEPPTSDAGPNISVCGNNRNVNLTGTVTIATGGSWTTTGSGTFANSNALTTTYTPSDADTLAGSVTLRLTTTDNGSCLPVFDEMIVTITDAPSINPGTNQTVCANNATVSLNGSVKVSTGGLWSSTGTGTFSPGNTALNASYIPSATDKTNGSVTLTLTTTGNGNCAAVSAPVTVTITPAPTANAGTDVSVCANNPTASLAGAVTIATGGTWTGGTGIFSPDRNTLNATYTPSATELSNKTVTLTLNTTGNGNCTFVNDQIVITITDAPTINAGSDQAVCGNSASIPLNATTTVATGGTWTTSGTGTFSPNANTLNAAYLPSAEDQATGLTGISLTVTSTGMGNCLAVNDQMTLTFTPVPTVNAGPDKTVCTNDFPVQLEGSGSPSTWSGGGGAYTPGNTTLNATYVPTAGEIAAGSVELTLTTIPSGACPTINDKVIITLAPGPVVNAGADFTVCGDQATIVLSGSILNAGGGIWFTSGTGSFSPDANTVGASYVPSAADKASGSVKLGLTSALNGACSAESDSVIVSITPAVITDAGPDLTVCADIASIPLNGQVFFATGGTWTTSGTGTITDPNALVTSYIPSAADTAAGVVKLALTSTGNGLCNAVTDSIVITITPAPTVNPGAGQTICADEPFASLNGAITVATGGTWTSTGTGTFSPNNTTLITDYYPSAADTAAGSVTFTLTTTGNGTCNAVSGSVTLTITPAPTVNAGVDQTICADATGVNLAGVTTVATGGLWTTSGTGTFDDPASLNAIYTPSAADTTGGLVVLTLTTTGNGTCQAYEDKMEITITDRPTPNAGLDQTICADKATVDLAGTVLIASGGQWSTSGTGTFADANNLNTTYSPSAADTSAGIIYLVLTTTGNGTCNPVKDTLELTITPAPTVNAGTDETVCADIASVALNGTVTVATGGTWVSSGTGTFTPNATTLNTAYIPSAADTSAGSVTFTLTTTGNGSCNAVSDTKVLTITPAPTVNPGADQTICANNSLVTLNGTVTVATGGTWGGGAGTFNPDANTLNATYTPDAAEIAAGTVTLTLTTTGNGTCNSVSENITITITPAPTVDAGSDRSICANNASLTLNGAVTVATGGTWSGGTGTFSPDEKTLNASYIPSATEITNGTAQLILTTTGNGLCNAVTDTMEIAITPGPNSDAGPDQTICADADEVSLAGTVSIASGGEWTTSGSGIFTPNAADLNAKYIPSDADTAAGTVTLTLTTTGNGTCLAVGSTMDITITPAPTVNAGVPQTVCANNNSVNLNGAITIATGGTWSGGTGSFAPDANTLNATYSPSAAEIANGFVNLTLTTTGNGTCKAKSSTINVTITPAPVANAGADVTVCANNNSVILNGSVLRAAGGDWSGGAGVFTPGTSTLNASYTPSVAEISAKQAILFLSTTGNGLCNAVTDTIVITITDAPVVSAGIDQTVCADTSGISLSGTITIASGALWTTSGTGIFTPDASTLNATYIPSAADIASGNIQIALTSTGNGSCLAVSDTMVSTITPAPTADSGPDQTVCADVAGVNLNGNITVASGGTWTTFGSGTFSDANSAVTTYIPSTADTTAGSVTLRLTTTGNGSCKAVVDQVTITITPAPVVDAGLDKMICADAGFATLNGKVYNVGGGTWTTSGTGTFSPNANTLNANYIPSDADTTAGSVQLTLTTTGNGTCIAKQDIMILTINPAPVAEAGANKTICADAASVSLAGAYVNNAAGGLWTSTGTGVFTPNANTVNATYIPSANDKSIGTITLTLFTTGVGTCMAASDQLTLTITPAPTANAGANQTICADASGAQLTGSVTVATGGIWTTGSGTGTFSPSATDLNAVFIPSATQIAAGEANLTLTTTGNGTCNAVTSKIKITITPRPVVNAGPNQTICADLASLNLNGSVANAGGGTWTTTGTGTFSNANNPVTTYTPSAFDKTAGQITLTLTSTGNGTCNTYADDMILKITPAPTVDAGPASLCADGNGVQLSGTVTVASGGTWTTTGTGTFSTSSNILNPKYTPSAADQTAGSVTLRLTTTGNGTCNAVFDEIALGIQPSPVANAGSDKVVCANTGAVSLNGSVSNAGGGIWSASGGGTFTANATTLNATYTPSAVDILAGSATLTLTTTGNGLCIPAQDQMVITITPAPTANAGTEQIVCADTAGIQLSGSVTIATGGTWTSSNGTGSFSPDANSLNAVYQLSAADMALDTLLFTLTTTGNGSCNAVSHPTYAVVTPAPTVTLGPDVTICGDVAGYAFNAVTTVATGVSWATSGSGSFQPNNTNNNILYYFSNADTTTGNVSLFVTTTGNGTCKPTSDTITITITDVPTVNVGAGSICADSDTIQLNGSVTTATGAGWTSLGTGTFVPDTSTLNVKYVPSVADKAAGNVTLILTSTGNGDCNAVSDTATINISPAPISNAGPDQIVCANEGPVTLAGTIQFAGGGIWSTSGSGTFADNTDLGTTYTPSAADTVAKSVQLILSTTGNGTCNAVTDTMTITITPAPIVDAGPAVVCSNNPIINLSGTVYIATGGQWSTTGTGVFGDINNLTTTYAPSAADIAGGVPVYLVLTSTGNGTCLPVTDTITLNITPPPTANTGGDQTVCADNNSIVLNGSVTVATGGTWTTSGTGNFFDANNPITTYTPSDADTTAGTVTLYLTTTGNGACNPSVDSMALTINPAPVVDAGPASVCSNNPVIAMSGTVYNAGGGIWSTTGTGTFDDANDLTTNYNPSAADIASGSVTLTLSSTGNGLCNIVSDDMVLFFTPAPAADAGTDQNVCADTSGITLAGAVIGAGGGRWTSTGSGSFTPNDSTLNAIYIPTAADTASGLISLTLTTIQNGNCNAVWDAMNITIAPAPVVNAGTDKTVCGDIGSVALTGIVNNAGGGTWSSLGTGTFANANALATSYNITDADTTAGSVQLVLTSTGNGSCKAVTDTLTVNLTPVPTVDAGPAVICTTQPGVDLDGMITVATGGVWTTSGTGSFAPNATSLSSIYILSDADTTAGSVMVYLTTTGNGTCKTYKDSIQINFVDPPTADAGPDQTHCADVITVTMNGNILNAAGGLWTSSGSGTFDDGTDLGTYYRPSSADTAAGSVQIYLETTGVGVCPVSRDSLTLTLTPAPIAIVNAGNDTSVCADYPDVPLTGRVLIAQGGEWVSSGTGIFAPNAFTLNGMYMPDAADIAAGSVTLVLRTTGNGTCNPVTDTMVVTITQRPSIDAGVDITVCADTAGVPLSAIVNVATGGTWITSGSGKFDDPNSLTPIYYPSASDISDSSVVLSVTSTGNGACSADFDNVSLFINPAPTVNAGFDQTVCGDNAAVNLAGAVTIATGGTWSTSGTGTFDDGNSLTAIYSPSAADTAAGLVNLILTTTGNGLCKTYTDTMTITITDAPVIEAGANQVICADSTMVQLNGSVTVASGAIWTSTGTGSFLPSEVALVAIYMPSDSDRVAGTIKLALTSTGNGSCNTVSDTLTLTITPAPTVNAGTDQTICADIGQLALNGVITVATGGTWTTSGSGVFDDANNLTANYIPSAADTASGFVQLTLTTTGNGTCKAVKDNLKIEITPAPTVEAGPNQTICADASGIQVNGSVTIATGGNWTTSGTGTFDDANSLSAFYTPSAADTAAGFVRLYLTTTGNGDCNAYTDSLTLTITPAPTANAGAPITECSDISSITLNGSVTVATSGDWTSTGTGSFAPTANMLAPQYFPSDADKTAGSVDLILTTTGNGTCFAVKDTLTLTLTPIPTIDAGPDQTVCANNASVNLSGSVTTATGGNWTTSGTGTFSDPNDLNATYTPSAADIAAKTVILTLTSTGNGTCNPVSDNVKINITDAPTANAGPDRTVCANNSMVTLMGSVTVGTGGIWSGGTGVIMNPASLISAYMPSAAEATTGTVRLYLTTTGVGNCTAVTDSVDITITPAPTANAGLDNDVCANNPAYTLNGSVTVATGGTWTGSGSFAPNANALNAQYIPTAAAIAAGSDTLYLTTTGNGSCFAVTDTLVITITPTPVVNAGSDQTVCANNAEVTLNGAISIATGGTWMGGTGTFTPDVNTLTATYTPSASDISNGSVILTLTSTGNGKCLAVSDQMVVTITDAPTVNAGPDQILCSNNATATLNGAITVASGATWSGGAGTWLPNANSLASTYQPTAGEISTGSLRLYLTTTGNGNCLAVRDSMDITFTPSPTVTPSTATPTVCADIGSVQLNGAITIATGADWTTSGSGTFAPNGSTLNAQYVPSAADIAAGKVDLTLTTTGNGNCLAVNNSIRITITPKPTINAGTDQTMCADGTPVQLGATKTVATGVVWSSSGTGSFSNSTALNPTYDPSAADRAAGVVNLTVTTTGNGTCKTYQDNLKITITPAPTVNAGIDQTVCADVGNVSLNGVITVATGGMWRSTGTGTFTPNANTLNAGYIPSPADTAAGVVKLALTTTGNGQCLAYFDTVVINITPAPVVGTIGATICADTSGVQLTGYVYNATGVVWSTTGTGYFAPNANTINAYYKPSQADITAGLVVLTITSDGNGTCNPVSTDMNVIITPLPVSDGGVDQTICRGASTTLTAFVQQDIKYAWYTTAGVNIVTSGIVDVTANSDTLFVLESTDTKGCSVYDTVAVNVIDPPTFNMADHYCLYDNLIIDANPTGVPAVNGTYQWYRNDTLLYLENNTTLAVENIGEQMITYTYEGCSISDTTVVTPLPVMAGIDKTVCEGQTTTIGTDAIPGGSYQWMLNGINVGTNSDSLLVSNIMDTLTHIVRGTDALGCINYDTIVIFKLDMPIIPMSDLAACRGDVVTLVGKPTNIPPSPSETYNWYKNNVDLGYPVTTDQINVTTDAVGNVTSDAVYSIVYKYGECTVREDVNVRFNVLPEPINQDTFKFCLESDLTVTLNAGPASAYEWLETGNTDQTEVVNTQNAYNYVRIFNEFGCSVVDSIYSKDVCPPRVFVPTAFKPGQPGPDEYFKVFGDYYANFKVTIYNRWGEIIFHSDERYFEWDGKYLGEFVPPGTYPVVITYGAEHNEFAGERKEVTSITVER